MRKIKTNSAPKTLRLCQSRRGRIDALLVGSGDLVHPGEKGIQLFQLMLQAHCSRDLPGLAEQRIEFQRAHLTLLQCQTVGLLEPVLRKELERSRHKVQLPVPCKPGQPPENLSRRSMGIGKKTPEFAPECRGKTVKGLP